VALLSSASLNRQSKQIPSSLYSVWYIPNVKVTFELPAPIVQQLRAHVPSGERSKFVSELISRKLQRKRTALEEAAEKANRLTSVTKDMKDWEALNGYED
jgi:hypothetical protein